MFIIASIVGVFSFFSTYETSSEYSSAYDETFMIIDIFIYIAAFMFSTMYYAGMHASKWQGTLGKIIVGIKVTDLNGQRISFARALGRYFATILSGSILYIGYIMAAFTQKKQSLHDVIARTMVVYKK